MHWNHFGRIAAPSRLPLAIAALAAFGQAHATNGYYTHGVGLYEKSMAGATVALAGDALSQASNPAALLQLGNRADGALSLFMPYRSYESNGNASKCMPCGPGAPFSFSIGDGHQEIDSDNNFFYIPGGAYVHQIDDVSAWGVAAYGQGGMNTEYHGGSAYMGPSQMPGTFGGGAQGTTAAGVDLAQMFITASYARRLGQHDLGLSAVVVYQRFEMTGLSAFEGFSTHADKVSDNGHDGSYGAGVKLGYQYHVNDNWHLGLAYRPEIEMTKFDKYAGLFANDGGFNIPANMQAGLGWRGEGRSLGLEYERINYSDVGAVGNNGTASLQKCAGGMSEYCLGGGKGAGFGYRDMEIYKIGYEWAVTPLLTWRVGYSHGNQPIPSDEMLFAVLAPAVMEKHYTTGFSYKLQDQWEISAAAMYAPEQSLKGPNGFDPAQTIETRMDQYELSLGVGKKF